MWFEMLAETGVFLSGLVAGTQLVCKEKNASSSLPVNLFGTGARHGR